MLASQLQHYFFGELKSKLQPRPTNFGPNNFPPNHKFVTFCTYPQLVFMKAHCQYLSEKVYINLSKYDIVLIMFGLNWKNIVPAMKNSFFQFLIKVINLCDIEISGVYQYLLARHLWITQTVTGVKHNNIPEPDSEMKQVQNSSACLHK